MLSLEGRLTRLPYALLTAAVFLSQHAVAVGILSLQGRSWDLGPTFVFMPLRTTVLQNSRLTTLELLLLVYVLLAYALLVAWLLTVLAFRRARDAGHGGLLPTLAFVPFVQLAVFPVLSFMPSVDAATPVPTEPVQDSKWGSAAKGVLFGTALAVFLVAVGTLVFGAYGYGIFVAVPFIIGASTGYIANRDGDRGSGPTQKLALTAAGLGGLALILTAIEGAICIVMAAPLGAPLVMLGAVLGRAAALRSPRHPGHAVGSVALLPLVFVGEALLPPLVTFQIVERITVAAPAARVWPALVTHDLRDEPVSLPYRLGLAHPKGGWIEGEGVGAKRYGVFSTGTAVERVTAWEPGQRLTFVVEKDVPPMHELSPYAHVHAPHAVGDYFTTQQADFALRPLEDGSTEVVLTTAHTLRLDPVFYWLPLAHQLVSWNDRRVLAHIKRRVETQRLAAR
jgi:uncharacterized membrane protein YhaH (DUF805 family)